jgi:hypothetical protein
MEMLGRCPWPKLVVMAQSSEVRQEPVMMPNHAPAMLVVTHWQARASHRRNLRP